MTPNTTRTTWLKGSRLRQAGVHRCDRCWYDGGPAFSLCFTRLTVRARGRWCMHVGVIVANRPLPGLAPAEAMVGCASGPLRRGLPVWSADATADSCWAGLWPTSAVVAVSGGGVIHIQTSDRGSRAWRRPVVGADLPGPVRDRMYDRERSWLSGTGKSNGTFRPAAARRRQRNDDG